MALYPGLGFGAGQLLAAPQATSGNPAPNPTPLQIGAVQNVKCTFGGDIKELYSQNQWAIDSAVGKRSIKGSFEFAQMSNEFFSQMFFADAVTVGSVETAINEPHTIPATPFSVTTTNAAHFTLDLGVTYAASGIPLQNVETLTGGGQYTYVESTGVYTFDAADTLVLVLINYMYSNSTLGTSMVAGNHPMGWGPVMQLDVVFPYEGGGIGFLFPNVRLGKIDLTTKLDDYLMMQTDFQAFVGSGTSPFTSYQAF
jgi:hypothetical protein